MSRIGSTSGTLETSRMPRVNWRRALVVGGFAALIAAAGYLGFQAYTANSLAGQNTTVAATTSTLPGTTGTTAAQTPGRPAGTATSSSAAATGQGAAQTAATAATTVDTTTDLLTYVSVPAIANVDGVQLRNDDGSLLATLASGSTLAASAHTPDGTWLLVNSASGSGWVQADQLIVFGVDTIATASVPLSVLMAVVTQPVADAKELTPVLTAASDATLQTLVTSEVTPLRALVQTGGDRLNVRSGPDATATVISKVNDGTALTVVGRNATGDWLQVQVLGTTSDLGWVAADYVQLTAPALTAPITM